MNCLTYKDRIKYIENRIEHTLPLDFIRYIENCDDVTLVKSDFKYYDIAFQDVWWSGIGCFLDLNESSSSGLLEMFLSPPEFFPEGLVAFADTGGGDFICFDYRDDKVNLDPPIVLWRHGADVGKDVSFIAKNFEAFLEMLEEPEDED